MMNALSSHPQNIIYALDIGTRNVVGIIGERKDECFNVIAMSIMAHPERAMYDGQIHDIGKVAKTVSAVTADLEKQTGYKLERVAIAAAGRALKTERIQIEKEIDIGIEIDKAVLDAIEIEAVQAAQKKIENVEDKTANAYYCVGYSVVNYYLDGILIANPIDHAGRALKLDLIATFLPHSVVSSLYTVVDKTHLHVVNLTLEPIAAINLAIPQKFRLLNIALVDIGAGTSDIALTKSGVVFAYGMVDVAGDELTESLVKKYLLDFDTAEHLKTQLNQSNNQTFTDIVGISHTLKTEDVLSVMQDAIENLTRAVAKTILEINGGEPSAVFLVGGGCQVPGLAEALSGKLNIPKERIVIKGVETLEAISYQINAFEGPLYITPLGIGYTALLDKDYDFLQVLVNDKPVRLFNSKQMLVLDALVVLGYSARNLLPKRGESIRYTINGKAHTLQGGFGEPSIVKVNGKRASLDTPIQNKDVIVVNSAVEGKKATATLADVLPSFKHIIFDGVKMAMVSDLKCNELAVDPKKQLKQGDVITYTGFSTFGEFVEYIDQDIALLFLNGKSADEKSLLKNGDVITVKAKQEKVQAGQKKVEGNPKIHQLNVTVNGSPIVIKAPKKIFIFVDIFDYIDFDLKKPKGIINLKLNGERANYTDILKNGDIIELNWKN